MSSGTGGSKGSPVAKTEFGRKVGSLFDVLEAKPTRKVYDRPVVKFLISGNEIKTRRIYLETGVTAPLLFSAHQAFDVKQAGEYTLRIRFQLLKSKASDEVELIRFAPNRTESP